MSNDLQDDLDGYAEDPEWSQDSLAVAYASLIPPPPPPTNDDDVRRLMRWLRSAERQAAEIRAAGDAEIARIRAWVDDRTAGLDRRADMLRGALEGWVLADPRKTISTPYGVIRRIAARPRVEITDVDAVVAFALAGGRLDWLRITPSKSALAHAGQPGPRVEVEGVDGPACAAVDINGEVIPGIVFAERAQDSVSIRTAQPRRDQ